MISVVVVGLNRLKEFVNIFAESVVEKSTHVSEVIIVNVDKPQGEIARWTNNNIKFKVIGGNQTVFDVESTVTLCSQHAFGLHLGLEHTTNEHVMFSDPDIFFYTAVDEYYLSLMNENDLNFVGICRPAALTHSILFFPTIVNCLVKKSDLPPNSFAKEICPINEIMVTHNYDNKNNMPTYLYPMLSDFTPEDCLTRFPNPKGHYETGSKLFLWALEKNWKWLSFQTPDQNNYYKNLYRNNFGFKVKSPREKLLYHESLVSGFPDKIVNFKKAFQNRKENTCIH